MDSRGGSNGLKNLKMFVTGDVCLGHLLGWGTWCQLSATSTISRFEVVEEPSASFLKIRTNQESLHDDILHA